MRSRPDIAQPGDIAQVNLYVPDELVTVLRGAGADLNWSEIFREAVVAALDCDHGELRCARCGRSVSAQVPT